MVLKGGGGPVLDRDALAVLGIDLDVVTERVEAAFGPGALTRPSRRRRRWRRNRCEQRPAKRAHSVHPAGEEMPGTVAAGVGRLARRLHRRRASRAGADLDDRRHGAMHLRPARISTARPVLQFSTATAGPS